MTPKQPGGKHGRHGKQGRNEEPQSVSYGGQGVGNYSAAGLGGDFAGNAQLIGFIENLAASSGFNRNYLYGVFSQVDVYKRQAQ